MPGVGRRDPVWKCQQKIDTMNQAAEIEKVATNSKAMSRRLKTIEVPEDCQTNLIDSVVVRLHKTLLRVKDYTATRIEVPAGIEYAWQVVYTKPRKRWGGTSTFMPKEDYFVLCGDLYKSAVVFGRRQDKSVRIWCTDPHCNDGYQVRRTVIWV